MYQDDKSVCIGAGTVLDAVTARDAILAGANYVVSPSFHAETAKMCNLYSTPYIPGCITLTEITTALEAGSEIIKLFPSSTLSPAYISAVKAPIPQVSVMVTGGVGLNNILNGSLLVQTPLELVANSINSLPKATLTASARLPNSMLHSDKIITTCLTGGLSQKL